MPETTRARLRVRLRSLIAAEAPGALYADLLADAAKALGPGDPLLLDIRCHQEIAASRGRTPRASLEAWTALREAAARALPETDRTFAEIESQYVRLLRIYGEFGALDEVVRRRTRRLELLAADGANEDGADEDMAGRASTDLSVALVDRGRFGRLDPLVADPRPEEDLRKAWDLAAAETERRAAAFAPDHPFTWHARSVACAAQVSLALHHGKEAELDAALETTDAQVDHLRRSRYRHDALMRARLRRAEVLDALGKHQDAEREATFVSDQWLHRVEGFDPSHALLVLARTQAARFPADALDNAELALEYRRKEFPERGHRVAEARELVEALRGASAR
ncbi:hypothetical protein [Actinomadura napierensis]|uniref:CHAT domain-containing protein n=1 Tax=Actinomadura napierensis TaxID=267854 RepID=A0ABN2YK89_9ACTN